MTSANGRFVIAFNGEIYNHLDLRDDLRISRSGPDWRGHSDTESLLAAFEEWGVDATLNRLVGMFAIALWDRAEHTLYLARDRFGEKPLYYGWVRGAFAFASELKALKAYPGFDNPVCRKALTQYLRHVYVPAPWSIYEGIFKLEPGCLLEIKGGEKVPVPSEPLRQPVLG
jgi:asparagine synthase (glutamine-hydrolysing)